MTEQTPQGVSLNDINIPQIVSRLSNWKNYVIYTLLVVILVLVGVVIWQRGSLAKAETTIAKNTTVQQHLIIERDLAKSDLKTCGMKVAEQNVQITKAGDDYAQVKKDWSKLDKFISDGIRNGTIFKSADEVRRQKTPKSCNEALDFMNRNTQ